MNVNQSEQVKRKWKKQNSWKSWGRGGGGNGGGSRGRRSFKRNIDDSNQKDFASHQSSTRQCTIDSFVNSNCPYKGWRLYFPEDIYSNGSSLGNRINCARQFIEKRISLYNKDEIEVKKWFIVDYKDLNSDKDIADEYDNLSQLMLDDPTLIVNTIGLAMHQILCEDAGISNLDTFQASLEAIFPIINCRIINYEPLTSLKNLKANTYGRFVAVNGTVIRASNLRPMCTVMTFECVTCSSQQTLNQPDGKYTLPKKCTERECKGKTFVPLLTAKTTHTIDWQSIRLQELFDDEDHESGGIPRTIDCELTNDLADSCVPGDVVTVCGIVKVNNSEDGRGRVNKDRSMFVLYIKANSLTKCKSGQQLGLDLDEMCIDDLYSIQEIQATNNLFRLVVQSLCPAIYGHEMIKAGLVLALLGGTTKHVNDENYIPIRGDIHVLVVGDPGLGKSQILQACSNLAPRGVFVCGNSTSTSGLTVTLTKETGSSDYSLEAGALVLADRGCCCIDEFDKMGTQHQALLEAMEQQCISIAKAGIVCSLPARTSILAAANPSGGSYNKAKTVCENLKMSGAILSRFDLVFILLDKCDEEHDSRLSEHVMLIHSRQNVAGNSSQSRSAYNLRLPDSLSSSCLGGNSLRGRLKFQPGESYNSIPTGLLRKYIAYARHYVKPKLSPEAASVIQEFYIHLRKQHHTYDSIPITTRQAESLLRLTEARAKLDLREIATKDDANDVIELMKYSMIDTYSDESGEIDFRRSQHGSGMSKQKQMKSFLAILNRLSEQTSDKLFTVQQMKQLISDGRIPVKDFDDFLENLNTHGFLLKKGSNVYKLHTYHQL
ncbi:MCM8 (predicted) [Pycnogonum litorale]